ncbi:MAG: DUF4440 domain-containing protein [Gemmatimonadales bacterium]|nr:MAG: DUF4440 domain-containing protein [Gemmatimonadales bacterium]
MDLEGRICCPGPPPVGSTSSWEDERVSDREAIERRRQIWIDFTTAGDVAGCVALLTEDAVWFPPGMAALSGREPVREWMAPFFEMYDYDFSVLNPLLRLAGNWALDRGTFTSTLTSRYDGRQTSHGGEYLISWRRESDGEWYIERYVHLSDLEEDASVS